MNGRNPLKSSETSDRTSGSSQYFTSYQRLRDWLLGNPIDSQFIQPTPKLNDAKIQLAQSVSPQYAKELLQKTAGRLMNWSGQYFTSYQRLRNLLGSPINSQSIIQPIPKLNDAKIQTDQQQNAKEPLQKIAELIKHLRNIEQKMEDTLRTLNTSKEEQNKNPTVLSLQKEKSILIEQIREFGDTIGCPFLKNINDKNLNHMLSSSPEVMELMKKHGLDFINQHAAITSEKRLKKLPELKPHQIIERAMYFFVYNIEYNPIYQLAALGSLKDYLDNITQLQPIYELLFKKIEELKLPARPKNFQFESIAQGMKTDLDYFKNHQKLTKDLSETLRVLSPSEETIKYLDLLGLINNPLILLGHLMVLLHLNTHGGTYGLRPSIIDVFERAGFTKNEDFYTEQEKYRHIGSLSERQRKIEKVVPEKKGGHSFLKINRIKAETLMRAWIDKACQDEVGNTDYAKIDKVLQGYVESFKHLGKIYETIMKTADLVVPTKSSSKTDGLLETGKMSYSPENRLINIKSGQENDVLMQLEYLLKRPPFSQRLKEIGVEAVVGFDNEPGSTHSPVSPDSKNVIKNDPLFKDKDAIRIRRDDEDEIKYIRLTALPPQTVKLIITLSVENQQRRCLRASCLDYAGIQKRIEIPLEESKVVFQLFDENLEAIANQLIDTLKKNVQFLPPKEEVKSQPLETKLEEENVKKMKENLSNHRRRVNQLFGERHSNLVIAPKQPILVRGDSLTFESGLVEVPETPSSKGASLFSSISLPLSSSVEPPTPFSESPVEEITPSVITQRLYYRYL